SLATIKLQLLRGSNSLRGCILECLTNQGHNEVVNRDLSVKEVRAQPLLLRSSQLIDDGHHERTTGIDRHLPESIQKLHNRHSVAVEALGDSSLTDANVVQALNLKVRNTIFLLTSSHNNFLLVWVGGY